MSISFQSSRSETMLLFRWECGRLSGYLGTAKTTRGESPSGVVKAYWERSRSVRFVKVAVVRGASLGCLIQGRVPSLPIRVIKMDGEEAHSEAGPITLSDIVKYFGESYPVEHRKDQELKGVILEAMAKLEIGHPQGMGAEMKDRWEAEYDRMKDHCGVGVRAPVEMSDLGLGIELDEAGWRMTYLPIAHGLHVLEDDQGLVRAWEIDFHEALKVGVGALRGDQARIAVAMEKRDREGRSVKV